MTDESLVPFRCELCGGEFPPLHGGICAGCGLLLCPHHDPGKAERDAAASGKDPRCDHGVDWPAEFARNRLGAVDQTDPPVRWLRPPNLDHADARTRGAKSQIVFLTAMHDEATLALVDRPRARLLLHGSLRLALDAANVDATIRVSISEFEVTASLETGDADAAFSAVTPSLLASPLCANGYVLLRYGRAGSPERQVSLAKLGSGGAAV